MRYLIDTDWLIDGITGISASLAVLASLRLDGVCVSIISLAELYEGVWLDQSLKRIF
jgi:tRNA(fMet)-specific endonuclease VapC